MDSLIQNVNGLNQLRYIVMTYDYSYYNIENMDRNKKFHCNHPACASRRHIPERWENHKRNNPDHDNATDKEQCTGKPDCQEC